MDSLDLLLSNEHRAIDFLVLTALREEHQAVQSAFGSNTPSGLVQFVEIKRQDTAGTTRVLLYCLDRQGVNEAQAISAKVVNRVQPRYVLMAGIAAGVPAKARMGDVLMPEFIFPYEHVKLSPGRNEHRAHPRPCSRLLHTEARRILSDGVDWHQSIVAPRPDGTADAPALISHQSSIVASGSALLADEGAEPRRRVLEHYPMDTLGFEMESIGCLLACEDANRPFLLVKAVQDDATAAKDDPTGKDAWRHYAMEASAKAVATVIRHFTEPRRTSSDEFWRRCRAIAHQRVGELPLPPFEIHVSRFESLAHYRRGEPSRDGLDPATALATSEERPLVLLHGGGGAGKTVALWRLMKSLVDAGTICIFLDFKRLESEEEVRSVPTHGFITEAEATFDGLLSICGLPSTRLSALRELSRTMNTCVIADGLNELSLELRRDLVTAMSKLHKDYGIMAIAADRLTSSGPTDKYLHFRMEPLRLDFVRRIFQGLETPQAHPTGNIPTDSELKLFTHPFFLALALRTSERFAHARTQTEVFDIFFSEHSHLGADALDRIASNVIGSYRDGIFSWENFIRDTKGDELDLEMLADAGVIDSDRKEFTHHLWRDYFVARALVNHPTDWIHDVLDKVTSFSSSLECLTLAYERLEDDDAKTAFLTSVYDWNYYAAVEVLAAVLEAPRGTVHVPPGIHHALVASLAIKRFASVEHTATKAGAMLARLTDSDSNFYRMASSAHAIREHVAALDIRDRWFLEWREVFSRGSTYTWKRVDMENLRASNSLTAWATANAAREGTLTTDVFDEIRTILASSSGIKGNIVRWRCIHVLAGDPQRESEDAIFLALTTDPYHWVRYGAARAVTQLGFRASGSERARIVGRIMKYVEAPPSPGDAHRDLVMNELVGALMRRNGDDLWKRDILKLGCAAVRRIRDPIKGNNRRNRLEQYLGQRCGE